MEPPEAESSSIVSDLVSPDVSRGIQEEDRFSGADHYEILRLGQEADEDTINRVYQTLALRFHPDNPNTGDSKTFFRIKEAYGTLSDPLKRAQYNVLRQRVKGSARFRLRLSSHLTR